MHCCRTAYRARRNTALWSLKWEVLFALFLPIYSSRVRPTASRGELIGS
jgi:hypothetical protein